MTKDIRYGSESNEVVRVDDGLSGLIEAAMEISGSTIKAQFARQALAMYCGWVLANRDMFKCEECGAKLNFYTPEPKFIYQCDCGIPHQSDDWNEDDEWDSSEMQM